MDQLKLLQREIEDITERYRAAGYFPSASVRVFDNQTTLAAYASGEATVDALFDMASVTKIATATQVLLLIRQGKIALHGLLTAYLPEIEGDPALRERLRDVEIYHLLTHTSTIDEWFPFYARKGEDFYTVLRYALAHTRRVEGMLYSDINFMLLGKLLEKAQGKPLEVCLQEDLVQPLGLGRMTYRPDASLPIVPSCYGNPIEMDMCRERGIAFDGFRPLGVPVRGAVNDGNAHYYFDDVAGHAGIFADTMACQRLCQFYMNTDDPLLVEAQREQPGAPTRGLGFQTGTSYPHGCGHTGFTGTSIYFSKECGVGVAALTNRLFFPKSSGQLVGEYRRALQEAVFAMARRD